MKSGKDENKLIESAFKNREAFEKFVCLYYSEVFNYIYKRTLDKNITDDLTQETFLKVMTHLKTFRGKCPLIFWILRIATNTVNEYYRKEIRKRKNEERLKSVAGSEKENITDKEKDGYRILHSHILHLKPVYQTVIVLRFFDEMNFVNISSIINRSPDATKKLYYRALAALKKDIEKSVTDLEVLRLIYGDKNEE